MDLYQHNHSRAGCGRKESDLTSVFSDVLETLYAWCCHYNACGYEMIAEHVAAAILDSMPDWHDSVL